MSPVILLWIAIGSIATISALLLAFKSMSEYKEKPNTFPDVYGCYLIQHPSAITQQLLTQIYHLALKSRWVIAIERLAKGERRALVIYGPNKLLLPLSSTLKLVELEDYSLKLDSKHTTILDVRVKADSNLELIDDLGVEEQLWYQLLIQPVGQGAVERIWRHIQGVFISSKRLSSKKDLVDNQASFYSSWRIAILATDIKRREQLQKQLVVLPIPSPYTTAQKVKFYQDRALPIKLAINNIISVEELERLSK